MDFITSFADEEKQLKESIHLEMDQSKCSQLCARLWYLYYSSGSECFERGDYEGALQQHLKAVQLNQYAEEGGVSILLLAIGIEYEKLAEYDEAIGFYKKLLERNPPEMDDKTMLLQLIGQCFDKKGDEKSAYEYFGKLFSISPFYDNQWYTFYRFAKLAYKYRNLLTSLEYFQAAIKTAPSEESRYVQSSLQHIGYIYLEKEAFNKAIRAFKLAIKMGISIGKTDSEIMCGLAQAYFGKSKYAKAIKYSELALAKPHDDEIAKRLYFLLAFCYSIKNDDEKEHYYTVKLQKLNPNSPYLRELL